MPAKQLPVPIPIGFVEFCEFSHFLQLRERLTQEELRKFAEHLHHFRKGTLPIKIFCERLLAIYSEQRKSLLLGWWSYTQIYLLCK